MWTLVGSHPQNYMRSGSAPLGWVMAAYYKNMPIPIYPHMCYSYHAKIGSSASKVWG